MRFILVENAPIPTDEQMKKWNSADDNTREEICRQLIQKYRNKKTILDNVVNSFIKSCYLFGIDPKKNGFMNLIDALSDAINLNKNVNDCLSKLIDMVRAAEIPMPNMSDDVSDDGKRNYILEKSLYQRNPKDFEYTVKAFETVSNPQMMSKFFKETDGISIEAFYDEQENIKPAGDKSTADDTNTIYGVIESWAKAGENEKDSGPQKKISKQKLKDAPTYTNMEDIPEQEAKEGNIIHVDFLKHNRDRVNFEDQVDAYFQYRGGKWNMIET